MGVGGLRVWPGSHQLGLCPCRKNVNGHYEAQIAEEALARFHPVEIAWNYGDLLVIDGLLLHQALPNQTPDRMRLVQLFRYSNVRTEEATSYFWQSHIYTRRGVNFAEAYPSYDLGAFAVSTPAAAR
jgi:ectoine hydroxylase-related dioxygenase (phytanoyl-CoA dioxygenase family)